MKSPIPKTRSIDFTFSFTTRGLPNRNRAECRASSSVMPSVMLSAVRISRCESSSSSISRSRCDCLHKPAKRFRNLIGTPLCKAQNALHAFHQLLPALFGFGELFSTQLSQPVILRFPPAFVNEPFRVQPAVLLHAMQSWIERTLLNLQQLI